MSWRIVSRWGFAARLLFVVVVVGQFEDTHVSGSSFGLRGRKVTIRRVFHTHIF